MIASHLVSPTNIQKELDLLWNQKENVNKVRASLFNVIFVAQKSHRYEYMQKIAYKLIEKFPARIFFISLNPDADEHSLQAAVAVLTTQQGEFEITCDLIEISTSGKTDEQVPLLLLPHLIPDLPIFLVWGEDPVIDHPLKNGLMSLATRVIFDSESAEDLRSFCQEISKLPCEIADLNWARIESWKDVIANVFNTQSMIEKLKGSTLIQITYNAEKTPFFCHTKIQSIYLQAWLANRLGWTCSPKSSTSSDLRRFFYKSGHLDVEIVLQENHHSNLPAGMILGVDITTSSNEHFFFERNLDLPHQISLHHSFADLCQLPFHFITSKGESGLSLVKEICHKGTSEHYREVLSSIASWDKGSLC